MRTPQEERERLEGLGDLPALPSFGSASRVGWIHDSLERAEDFAHDLAMCSEQNFEYHRRSVDRLRAHVPVDQPLEWGEIWELLAVKRAATLRGGAWRRSFQEAFESAFDEKVRAAEDELGVISVGDLIRIGREVVPR